MDVKAAVPTRRDRGARARSRAMSTLPGRGPMPRLRRRVIAIVPGVGAARRARWQAGTVVPGVGPTARMRRRGRAVAMAGGRGARGALKGARAVDWPAAASVVANAAATRRRKRRGRVSRRVAMVGAVGLVGAGAAAVAMRRASERKQAATPPLPGQAPPPGERTDRDAGGPTAAPDSGDEQTAGGAPGTKPGSGFEPHG